MKPTAILAAVILFIFSFPIISGAQVCTALGQNPSTAFPVCGTTTFHQASVPICASIDLFVPGCSGSGNANYQNKNPYWYKFTCYTSGSLGFLITPNNLGDDYDWQLYDITGHAPDEVYSNNSLIVSGNWSGSYGLTGASASGVNFIQCASNPASGAPTFAAMPMLIAGHEYLLMISHYTDSQSGYSLSFGGGSAVITDPTEPHLNRASPDCDGKTLTLVLNKKMRCNSLSGDGSEFSIFPNIATVVSATASGCGTGFDFDTVTIVLSNPLTSGNYQLIINNGQDLNTLLDHCDRLIPVSEQVPFTYAVPQPIFADSIGRVGCSPDSVKVYFPKNINCNSIAADGSDFSVTGPTPVTVVSAGGKCTNGKTPYVIVKFSAPIYTKGNYQLRLKAGNDGTILIDECGQQTPIQNLPFTTADTVSALFQYTSRLGCRQDTLTFTHNGAHDVNSWNWYFNTSATAATQNHTIIFPATSINDILLIVSNGVCIDSARQTITLDNEVKASFDMVSFTCPEDPLVVHNTTQGLVDLWSWTFDHIATSNLKDPNPVLFPTINREAYYSIKLVATNIGLGCSDSARKPLTVLDFCFIDVPNAFTPNNDGLNDRFGPHNPLKADNYEFKVFNRWGQMVFRAKDWRDKWDGKLNGLLQGTGVYVWMMSYIHHDTKQPVFRKGTVTLIR
jgi:gliding motility-associated-like protein